MTKHRIAHQRSPQGQTPPPGQTQTSATPGKRPPSADPSSRRPKTATLERRGKKPAPKPKFESNNPMLRFIQKRPLLLIGMVCAGMVTAAVLAAIGLTHPDNTKGLNRDAVEPAIASENTPNQTQSQSPMMWYGAIGLGIAVGSWAMVSKLESPRRRRRRQLSKSLKGRPASRQQPSQQKRRTTPSSPKKVSASQKPPVPSQQKTTSGEKQKMLPPSTGQIPPWGSSEANLTETMDIRKRHSLSSVLRNR